MVPRSAGMEAKIARAGCFKYEAVDGAAANGLPGAVPEEVKEERWHRFMAVQQEVSAGINAGRIGRMLDVIVDEVDEEGAIGRSQWDAPEIDGVVHLADAEGLMPGDLVEVEITGSDGHDLWAAPPGRDD